MIRAILLAAGKGSRMGIEKQLLNWKESSLLKESIKNLLEVNKIDEIRVVLGYKAEKIKNNIDGFKNKKVKFLVNNDYEDGMHTTIKKGLEDIDEKIDHIIISLGDQPFIKKDIYNQVIDKYLAVTKDILVPTYEGKRGHPVIIKKDLLLSEIDDLEGAGGLRTLIKDKKELVYFYELDKKEVVIDLDYYDEYKLYRKKKAVENESIFLNYKFWLEGKEKVFGDGPCDILVRIDHYGSLKKAAEDINMSYSQAWNLINKIEKNLGFNLIKKRVGGESGGGSELTSKGRKLMNDFLAFRREIHDEIIDLEKKYFKKWK